MICDKCRAGGMANKFGEIYLAIGLHDQCTGCFCQHKTGEGWHKKGHKKAPHPVTGEGRVWKSKQLSDSNR